MREASPEHAVTPTGAVFLSYASQDAEAAQRICEALRAAGIEIWFDQSELRGGDAWDRQIRKQIHDCALFIPLISQHSQERLEGYFRLEWKLAVDRSHRMAAERSFIVPVVVDSTRERDALVPDSFRDVQWTHLPGGEASPSFVARVAALLRVGAPVVDTTSSSSTRVIAWPPATRNRRVIWIPLGLAALAIFVGGSWFALQNFALPRRAETGLTAQAQPAVTEKSIAVLPFVDLSEKHDQAYFSDGLADQILNELARIPALKVIGRTSSFRFKDKAEDLREVGRALGAIYVLEGSVRRAGDQIRVTAQLIDTRDSSHLWSEVYDRNSGNVLQLQEEIATAIARVLQVTITDYFKQQYTTKSPEAFDLYLRGIRDLDAATAQSTRRSLTEFERASQLDPHFVSAIVGQAYAYAELAGNAYISANEGYPHARLVIDRALALDPRNADAYATRALIRVNYDRDWSGGAADIAKAKELGGSRITYLPAAKIAGATGNMARAAELYEAQLATDPMDGESLQDLGWFVYPALGRYEEADAVLRRAKEVDPDYTNAVAYFDGINLLLRNRIDEAAGLIDAEKDETAREALRAAVDHARGRSQDSAGAIKRAIAAPNAWAWAIARSYAYRGDRPQALEWLNRAADDHENSLWTVRTDPMLRTLAGDEGFRAFLRKINIQD
jgi:TolB-like protein